MKTLKLLNKKNLSIIIFSLLLTFTTVAEEKPIDIWNIDKKEVQPLTDDNGFEENTKNDKVKTKLAKEAGLKIARIPYWLTQEEEEIEIENILDGKPSYPDVPDLKQAETKPLPN